MARDYYVVFSDGQWKVMLEKGPVLSKHRTQKAAKREAERLGRSQGRGVTVNAKGGYTRYRKGPEEL